MVMLLCFCILYGGSKAPASSSVIMTETEEQNPASLRYILAALIIENVCWALEQDIYGIILWHTADSEVDELSLHPHGANCAV